MYIDVLVASLSLSIYPFLYLAITLSTTKREQNSQLQRVTKHQDVQRCNKTYNIIDVHRCIGSVPLSIYLSVPLSRYHSPNYYFPLNKKKQKPQKNKKRCVFCSVLFLHDICHYYNIAFNSK